MLLDEYWEVHCKQGGEDALAKEQEEDYYGPFVPPWVRAAKMRSERTDKELREYPLGGTCRWDDQFNVNEDVSDDE